MNGILPSTTTLNLGQRNKSKFGIELHSKIPSIKSGFVHYIPLSLQNSPQQSKYSLLVP
jgi:hypothetical protein